MLNSCVLGWSPTPKAWCFRQETHQRSSTSTPEKMPQHENKNTPASIGESRKQYFRKLLAGLLAARTGDRTSNAKLTNSWKHCWHSFRAPDVRLDQLRVRRWAVLAVVVGWDSHHMANFGESRPARAQTCPHARVRLSSMARRRATVGTWRRLFCFRWQGPRSDRGK